MSRKAAVALISALDHCSQARLAHFGAGVIDSREVERLASNVSVDRLEARALELH